MIEFKLNGKAVSSKADPNTPLLWVIRDEIGLTGTKFGCGVGMCGACTVHVEGISIRSCSFKLKMAKGKSVTTIEGLNNAHPLQAAWAQEQVPQCGYCQSGQIMQAATLLEANPNPTDEEIVQHMQGNLCRCMAYARIKKAIKVAATNTSSVQYFDPRSNADEGVMS
ncbi:(2Fe-2S)-binding protein [Alteromonas sp. a30]|uniref:(2Fe-2S)-binding protein n=1 Tax=Alteromonas sp. a30 TaxID=2730917 RepID=UPI002281F1CB|nr:(2Fe-2S)-binding protein [Alteromonas sp. a30]MCY7297288.1 (2Fe-2S)-binding protein [Alteromonas sp. a30]